MSLLVSCVVALLLSLGQFGQSNTGQLHITVTDSSGLPLPGPVEVVSEANAFRQNLDTNSAGVLVVRRLPFGSYRVGVARNGFADVSRLIEIRSALPAKYHVTMNLATVQAQITVSADPTLLDPHQPASAHRVGAETLQERTTALPGRALADTVNTQPGWLLEANGILHPRGSEYQTQYVVDGLPLTDNRSPVFAPELGSDDVQAMTIMTGGYPAEYGRKLGGVIEVVTISPAGRGFGGSASASIGSFHTGSGDDCGIWRRQEHAQRDGDGRPDRSISRSTSRREPDESGVDGERFLALRTGCHCVEPIRRHRAARPGPVSRAERARAAGSGTPGFYEVLLGSKVRLRRRRQQNPRTG
jgi:hypothetical protein